MKFERNIIPRLIMKDNPNPKNFIVGCVFTMTILSLFSFFVGDIGLGIWFGVLFTVNIYHCIGIRDTVRNWNNKKYWILRKVANKVKLY